MSNHSNKSLLQKLPGLVNQFLSWGCVKSCVDGVKITKSLKSHAPQSLFTPFFGPSQR